MKKTGKQTTKKLKVKKVTLRDLDEPTLGAMAVGATGATCPHTVCVTCPAGTCDPRLTCAVC